VENDHQVLDAVEEAGSIPCANEFGFGCLPRAAVIVSLYMDGVQGDYNNPKS
jgi:hypothetical protein